MDRTDFAYVPRGSTVTVPVWTAAGSRCRRARATRRLPFRVQPAEDGAGRAARRRQLLAARSTTSARPDAFEADRLIACEVLTPGGNWSSYPPHKHDEDRPGESVLEEIYYFEVAPAAGIGLPAGVRHADRPIDVLAEVRTGDVVLIPHGWHGPSMAAPGYDLYYLNVMAGPAAERAWLICDDPAHAWVRDTWADQAVDPRLPLSAGGRA